MVTRILTRSNTVLMAATGGILAVEAIGAAVHRYQEIDALIVLAGMRLMQIALLLACSGFSDAPAALAGPWYGHRMVRAIRNGLIWSACFGAVVMVVGLVLYALGENPHAWVRIRLQDSTARLWAKAALFGFLGPVAEELFFRGVIYGFLRRWGMIIAMIGSTVLFASLHWIGTGAVPVVPAVGGLLFAAAYEREGHLVAPITIHMLGNLALFGLSVW